MIDAASAVVHHKRMLSVALIRMHRLVLLLTLTVALVATGFGHRMPNPQDPALRLALANGATLADFCGDLDSDGQRDPHCLACQIAGAADLPPVTPALIDLELAFHAQVIAPRESRAARHPLDPAHTPQGPPVA